MPQAFTHHMDLKGPNLHESRWKGGDQRHVWRSSVVNLKRRGRENNYSVRMILGGSWWRGSLRWRNSLRGLILQWVWISPRLLIACHLRIWEPTSHLESFWSCGPGWCPVHWRASLKREGWWVPRWESRVSSVTIVSGPCIWMVKFACWAIFAASICPVKRAHGLTLHNKTTKITSKKNPDERFGGSLKSFNPKSNPNVSDLLVLREAYGVRWGLDSMKQSSLSDDGICKLVRTCISQFSGNIGTRAGRVSLGKKLAGLNLTAFGGWSLEGDLVCAHHWSSWHPDSGK